MITYNELIWERKAHYGDPGLYFEKKTLYSIDESLERVKKAGYERHPGPSEVFNLLIANLENMLTVEQKRIASDMLNSYDECGEWLSIAFERMGRRGNILLAYINPEGSLTNSLYDKSNFRFGDKVKFSVRTIDETNTSWIRLEDDIFEFLYTRHFDELPEEMRAQIEPVFHLPIGEIWPIGRYNYSIEVGYGRSGNLGYNAASRGIREIK